MVSPFGYSLTSFADVLQSDGNNPPIFQDYSMDISRATEPPMMQEEADVAKALRIHQLLEWFPGILESLNDTVKSNTNYNISDKNETFASKELHPGLSQREKDRQECFLSALEEINRPLKGWCPRIWDQLLCWPPTSGGTVAYLPCDLVPEFQKEGNATRICDERGTWVGNASSDSPGWTNYTDCISELPPGFPLLIYQWLPMIKTMSTVGYSVSVVTLFISFGILVSLKKLRCPRNILHLHLFASFILRAFVVLIKSGTNMDEGLPPNLIQHIERTSESSAVSWPCQLLITIWQYFILANYSWILMEGLYLHNLIFLALFSDSSAITLYIILGWGLPMLCVCIWAILRANLDNVHCWTVNNVPWIFWLCIRIPVAVSNLLNFFFFLNVTRVLLLKMRSSISAESMKYRKLGKSTLVLVPLFGVHYFLLWGLSVSTNGTVELAWLLLDQVFASFQGFFVAVLYCLMNGEVRQELRKLVHRFKGDGLPELSYSTVMSHTRSYFSRGRVSIHSIHSTADKREGRQTPSPQMPRLDGPSISPRLTPTSVKLPELYSLGSSQMKIHDPLKSKSPSDGRESIELQTNLSVNAIKTTDQHPLWEEAVPLILNHDIPPKISEVQQASKMTKEIGSNLQGSLHAPLLHEEPPNSSTIPIDENTKVATAEINGVYGHTKELLVKVNSVNSSAHCCLLDNEQGESML